MAGRAARWLGPILLAFLSGATSATYAQTPPSSAEAAIRAVANRAQQAQDEALLKLLCAQQTEGGVISFITGGDGKVLLAALSAQPLADVTRDIWLSPRFTRSGAPDVSGSRTGTEDWAYVFDGNGDGQIDHMAFLIGPLPTEPEAGGRGLPNITGDRLQIDTAAMLDRVLQATRFGFWQARDEDNDGVPDVMAMPARRKNNGWYRGWAIFDRRATSEDASCRFMDRDGRPAGSCQAGDAPGDYDNRRLTTHVWVRDPGPIFSAILTAASDCKLQADKLARLPAN